MDYVSQYNEISDVFADLEKLLCIIPEYDVGKNIVDIVGEDVDVNLHEVIIFDSKFFLMGTISKHCSKSNYCIWNMDNFCIQHQIIVNGVVTSTIVAGIKYQHGGTKKK